VISTRVFAARLGLRRAWSQGNGDGRWHYDVTDSTRAGAIRLGAIPVTWRQTGDLIRARRDAEGRDAEGGVHSPDRQSCSAATNRAG
jgi:hypothetical protein